MEGDDKDGIMEDEADREIRESIEKELREKFSEVLEDQVMAEIMRVAGKQLQKRYLKKQGN